MIFPGQGSSVFSIEEVNLLNSWREEMKQTPEGIKIIENIEMDSNVPAWVWKKFLKNLIASIKQDVHGMDALRLSIDNDMLLHGPAVNRERLGEDFSKLIKVRSLFRYLNDNLPIFRGRKAQKQVCEWIEDGTITIEESFKSDKLQGRKPLVWATFTNEIGSEITRTNNLNDLCDKLGLLDFDECEYVIELRYNSSKAANVRCPTIIEAGDNPAFHPCEKENEYGRTWDLKNRDWGLPEVVHEPISFHNLDAISYVGHKDKDATSLFTGSKFPQTRNSK